MRQSAGVLTLSVLLAVAGLARADIITLNAVDRGFYDGAVYTVGNTNYVVGDPIDDEPEYRNFMVFDLSGVTLRITGAELILYNPTNGFGSDTGQETYDLFDVTTDIDTLRDGTGGSTTFDDLGTGTSYGSYVATAADDAADFTIPLNSAGVTALNVASGSLFAFGGAITSLNGVDDTEMLLGYTNHGYLWQTRLVLTMVPEPASLSLLGLGLLALARRRRRS